MKNFKPLFILIVFFPVLITSCLNIDTPEYTEENEMADLKYYVGNLITKGYDVDTTAMGVYYVILTEGEGDYPGPGDTISIKYAGYLLNGNIFDSSFYSSPDSSWTYVYKEKNLLASWDEITGLMNEGCKMEFIIPSSLAYGSTGAGAVPPYSSLVFVAIMSEIRKKQQ